MTMTVQLDLFNSVTPIATFDWANESNLKIFDYSDDMHFDDVLLEGNYVVNVPCYKIEDLVGLIDINKKSQYESNERATYWALVCNKKLNHCVVRITDTDKCNWAGNRWFVLANAKMQKFIKQKALFALLKGDIKKMPRLYNKVVQVRDINYRKDLKSNFAQVFVQNKWRTEHILEQI